MLNQELINFIKQSKSAGQTDEQIRSALRSVGWQEGDIDEGFKSINSPTQPTPQVKPVQNYSSVLYGGKSQNIVVGKKFGPGIKMIIVIVLSLILSAFLTVLYFYKEKLADLPVLKSIF